MNTSKRWLLVVGVTVLGLALSVARPGQSREEKLVEPSKKVVGVLGEDTITVLKGATKVECFRIGSVKSVDTKIKRIGDYPILTVGKEQGKDFAARLDNVLFADATYEGTGAKCFDPGVAFRLWTEKKEWVDVIICFHCQNLTWASYDANGKVIKDGGYAPFGGTGSWTTLVKMAKEAFPDDKAIQALKEDAK